MALNFSNIKSLFIIEEEDDSKQKSEKAEKKSIKKIEKKQVEKSKSEITWKSSNGSTDNANTSFEKETQEIKEGAFNKRIFESLTKAVSEANLPGEDYLEYMQALKAMKDLPLAEDIKIQTVLATLSTKGLTKTKIFESADYYISILENEKRKFYTAFETQAKGGVSKKKSEAQKIEKDNNEKAKQIAKLTQEITDNQNKIEKIKKEISQAENKHIKTENDFIFTYNKILKQIKSNIENIKNTSK